MTGREQQFSSLWQKLAPPDMRLHAEYRGIPGRRYRFDFAHVPSQTAIEIQGATFARRRKAHSSGMGLHRDYEKNNLAAENGWVTLYYDAKTLDEQPAQVVQQVVDVIRQRVKENSNG